MRESRPDGLVFLLTAICCLAPLFLTLGGLGLMVGFVRGYGGFVLIGLALVSGGYWLWRRKKQKGCCPSDSKDIP